MRLLVTQLSGEDYTPGKPPAAASKSESAPAPRNSAAGALYAEVEQQGNKVRDLKAAKAAQDVVQAAVKDLLGLKAKYKEV